MIDGFVAWAPELAVGDSGLSEHSFALIAAAEQRHFWFRSRNTIITRSLQRYFPQMRTFLEIGCGSGGVLAAVSESFPRAAVVGTEMASAGLRYAAQRAPGCRLVQMDARAVPYEGAFDVAAAFDVIEHIAEDEKVLSQMHQAVVAGGGVIITVPQHRWLWSAMDDYSRHFRRYSRRELVQKVEAAGFDVLHVTSFMSFILPAMFLSRLRQQRIETLDPGGELRIGTVANALMRMLCAAERGLLRLGVSLPAGGSLLIVARRAR